MDTGIDIIFVCAFYLELTLECWTTFTLFDREPYLRGKMPDGTPRIANPNDIPLIMSKLVYNRL